MALSNNEDVCIAGSITEDEVEVKLKAKFLLSILSLAIKNASTATKTTNFVFPEPPSLFSTDSQNKKVIKVEQQPFVSPLHATLLPSSATIYITYNNT